MTPDVERPHIPQHYVGGLVIGLCGSASTDPERFLPSMPFDAGSWCRGCWTIWDSTDTAVLRDLVTRLKLNELVESGAGGLHIEMPRTERS